MKLLNTAKNADTSSTITFYIVIWLIIIALCLLVRSLRSKPRKHNRHRRSKRRVIYTDRELAQRDREQTLAKPEDIFICQHQEQLKRKYAVIED